MTTLAIIGNGFDLVHKLKTNYKHFYKKMDSELREKWESVLKERKVEEDTWSNFEEVISDITSEWGHDLISIENNEGRKKKDYEKLENEITKINEVFHLIGKELFDFLEKETEKEIEILPTIKKYLYNDTYAINFNYTSTVNLYTQNIYHIHGSIKEEKIILGYKLRTEPIYIDDLATTFDKYKLREELSFYRFLLKNEISQDKIKKNLEEFKKHINMLNSGRGGYDYDYSEDLQKEIDGYFQKFEEDFNFKKLPLKIQQRAKFERLQQMSPYINKYGEINNFSFSEPDYGIDLSTVRTLLILGHSINADIDIFKKLFEDMNNLEKIILFIYQNEPKTEVNRKEEAIKHLSPYPIDINIINY